MNDQTDTEDLLIGLVENMKWQNAMMAEVAYELVQLQIIMMTPEGGHPDTPDREKLMCRAESFRNLWESEFHPEMRK